MTLKKNYLYNNNLYLKKNYDRKLMAKREFATFSYLLKVFFNFEFKKRAKIIDLGSGDQFLREEFEKREIEYYFLDIEDIDFEKDKFNFNNESFDFVISLAVLEHLNDPDNFLNECRRILKTDSFLFLSTPNWKYCYHNFFDDVTHMRPYTPKSLNDLLTIKKFKEIVVTPSLRCKSKWWYQGKYKFFRANYLLPFRGYSKFIPNFLSGKSTGMFAIAKK